MHLYSFFFFWSRTATLLNLWGITVAFLRGVLISQQQQRQLRGGMAMNAHIVKQILKVFVYGHEQMTDNLHLAKIMMCSL